MPVTLIDDLGAERAVPDDEVEYRLARGWSKPTAAQHVANLSAEVDEQIYGGPAGTIVAGLAAGARGLSGGGSDVVIAALGGGEKLRKLREQNPTVSTVGEVAGGLTGVGKIAGKIGAKVAGVGGGTVKQIARAGAGATTEGMIMGGGQGVTELALSDDELTVERIASVMGSNVLLGGATGGVVGVAGKGLGLGLKHAKAKLDDVASRPLGSGVDVATDDLASLDGKGLRAAKKAEIDALEAQRVPLRAEAADEIRAFRKELKESKVWLATKGADDAEIRAIGKRTLKADKALDSLLDDPKALAENPKAALRQLRVQEAALDDLVNKHGTNLRAKFASDATGDRVKALDFASTALERNRALQAKIADLSTPSARLTAIDDALAGRGVAKAAGGGLGDAIGDSALGYAVGAAAGLPMIGAAVGAVRAAAPLLKKLGIGSQQAAARGSKAIGAFLNVGAKVGPRAPVLASKVLGSARFSAQQGEEKQSKSLAASYKARSEEIRSQVEPTPDGKTAMRLTARTQLADRIAPIRAVSPRLADKLETVQARKVEFLASKLPRKPDLPGMGMNDGWQPSDMEMRTWARYIAAAEDPTGVVERLATGEVTPEDAETMRKVFPEMYAQIQMEIMMQLGELRARLPYQRRLALSIFSGVPIDPALDPRVLAILQGTYAAEQGTEGGVQAPKAQPAFGSVTKQKPTPAQERGA